jgi:CRISPR-associated protein Cas1
VRVNDLHLLPRFADGLTFLYVEKARVGQEKGALVLTDDSGKISVPVAALGVLMLGPGTSITHAAVTTCADSGCSIVFCGEAGVRFYASGLGETRRSANLLEQARCWADARIHLDVVRRMYRMRFEQTLDPSLSLEQIRGMEGVRVREAYAKLSRETGITWSGRAYGSNDWDASSPVNRALSTANTCLYGLCHAAIVSTGFSPGLGFVHTGKNLAFVYDIADLYKVDITVPIAFRLTKAAPTKLDTAVRQACRTEFRRTRLIERIVPDIQRCLGLKPEAAHLFDTSDDAEIQPALWGPDHNVEGAVNYGSTQ